MKEKKKQYKSPELFELQSMEVIGACIPGGEVTECTTGGIHGTNDCISGGSAKNISCSFGADAWAKL